MKNLRILCVIFCILAIATCFAPVLPTKASGDNTVYKEIYLQDWESGAGGWYSKYGPSDPVDIITVSDAPSPTHVHKITRVDAGGNYFSPLIPVSPGKTYCVAGWIKWVSGGWAFIGIDHHDVDGTYMRENWLIGMPGYWCDQETGCVTPVPIDVPADEWHWYAKVFTMPEDTFYIALKNELWQTSGRGGSPLGYFDDIALYEIIVPATIDINPNTLNLKSKGKWITCYIELPDGYSVVDIDVESIRLNVAGSEFSVDLNGPITIGDYDSDGVPDLMVKFDRAAIVDSISDSGQIEFIVTGLVDDASFEGSDTVRVK
ncbi:MAG: hypothetical protein ACFFC7_14910 [Candidatus Hermodarchaeota archaeon]